LGSILPLSGYSSGELSEEQIIFDKSVMERGQESSKSASPRTTPQASSGTSFYQLPDHATPEQETWTLTRRPDSTPLMAVPTLNDSARTEIWTSKEIPEASCPDSSLNATSLSDCLNVNLTETPAAVSLTSMSLTSQASEREGCVDSDLAAVTGLSAPTYDLTDKESSSPFTAQSRPGPSASSKQTNLVSVLSPYTSKPSLSLLSTASNELTPSIIMASDGTSSCKTPVAARSDVVIAMDDDDGEMDNSRDKSESEELSAFKDADKGSNITEVVLPMGLNDERESSTLYQCKSGQVIYKYQESDAIIDIMGRDHDDEKMPNINEKSNQGTLLLVMPKRYIINYSSLVKFVLKIHAALRPQSQNR